MSARWHKIPQREPIQRPAPALFWTRTPRRKQIKNDESTKKHQKNTTKALEHRGLVLFGSFFCLLTTLHSASSQLSILLGLVGAGVCKEKHEKERGNDVRRCSFSRFVPVFHVFVIALPLVDTGDS
jgi:hypothetical protein